MTGINGNPSVALVNVVATLVGTLALVARTSGVVAVARLNQTPRDAVRRMVRIATAGGGRILGAVATGATSDGREAGIATNRRMDSRFTQANRARANGL